MCKKEQNRVQKYFFLKSAKLTPTRHHPPQEALNQQLNPFLREVKQQLKLPILRSYLKLYSTITLEKLALTTRDTKKPTEGEEEEEVVPEIDIEEESAHLTRQLMCLKHKSKQLVCWWNKLSWFFGVQRNNKKKTNKTHTTQVWGGGGALSGNMKVLSDVDLYLTNSIVHIDADFRRPQAGAGYFVRYIESLQTASKVC